MSARNNTVAKPKARRVLFKAIEGAWSRLRSSSLFFNWLLKLLSGCCLSEYIKLSFIGYLHFFALRLNDSKETSTNVGFGEMKKFRALAVIQSRAIPEGNELLFLFWEHGN